MSQYGSLPQHEFIINHFLFRHRNTTAYDCFMIHALFLFALPFTVPESGYKMILCMLSCEIFKSMSKNCQNAAVENEY